MSDQVPDRQNPVAPAIVSRGGDGRRQTFPCASQVMTRRSGQALPPKAYRCVLMKSLVSLTLVAAVCATVPVSVDAESRWWLNECLPGAFAACASFSLEATYDPMAVSGFPMPGSSGPFVEGYTRITLGMTNLQGAPGLPDPGPWGLGRAAVLGMETTWTTAADKQISYLGALRGDPDRVAGPYAWIDGPAGTNPSQAPFLGWEAFAGTYGGGWLGAGSSESWLAWDSWYGVVVGCTPLTSYSATMVSTCDRPISLTFDVPGRWTFTDRTRIAWGGGRGTTGVCTTGVDCRQATVVPEPSAYVLMLTGLLGLGFVAWRRKDLLA